MRVSAVNSYVAVKPLFKGNTNKIDVEKKNNLKNQTVSSQPLKCQLFK